MTTEKEIVLKHPKDPSSLLDVIRDVQTRFGHVSDESVSRIAAHLKLSEAEVRGAVTSIISSLSRPGARRRSI